MIRSVKISLKYANKAKTQKLKSLFNEVLRVKQLYIDKLWKENKLNKKKKKIKDE